MQKNSKTRKSKKVSKNKIEQKKDIFNSNTNPKQNQNNITNRKKKHTKDK